MTEFEEWRRIPDWPYEVSSLGRIRRKETGRVLKPILDKNGYHHVSLSKGKARKFRVHILVCLAFNGPRPLGHQCRHYPDNKPANNRASNLSGGTAQRDADDRRELGTQARGHRHGRSKLDEVRVRLIREDYTRGITKSELARRHGVDRRVIWGVVQGVIWRHV